MCIVFVAVQQHPKFPLIIAANRDEFYNRPTSASQFWPDTPSVLAGKDLQAGGSWMGVTRNGYLAALTNIRDPSREKSNARSRGELVVNYLKSPQSIKDYYSSLSRNRDNYNGYNLIYGHYQQLAVYNNFADRLTLLEPGVHGLSNAQINSPWPKIIGGTQALADYISSNHSLAPERLFDLLANEDKAPIDKLPNTGVPLEWEERLSSIFIRSEDYGTRSSTLLLINNNGYVNWYEKSLAGTTASRENSSILRHYEWKIPQ